MQINALERSLSLSLSLLESLPSHSFSLYCCCSLLVCLFLGEKEIKKLCVLERLLRGEQRREFASCMSKDFTESYYGGFGELANPLQWPQLRKRRRFLLQEMILLPSLERLPPLLLWCKIGVLPPVINLPTTLPSHPWLSLLMLFLNLPQTFHLKVHSFPLLVCVLFCFNVCFWSFFGMILMWDFFCHSFSVMSDCVLMCLRLFILYVVLEYSLSLIIYLVLKSIPVL